MTTHPFTEAELKLIGDDFNATYSHQEEDVLVLGSWTFPSYRITVKIEDAIKGITEVKSRSHIETDSELIIAAKVVRLCSKDGTDAIKRQVWAKYEWLCDKKEWIVNFYINQTFAYVGANIMTEFPSDIEDLIREGKRKLDILNRANARVSEVLFDNKFFHNTKL